jgi:urea transport system substrate-binding protein
MEASWFGFQLWTQAVADAGTTDVGAARKALPGRSIRAPSGFDVVLDAGNQHLHKPSIIGRMDEKNVIWPVWTSKTLIAPEPWSQWLPKDAKGLPILKRAV